MQHAPYDPTNFLGLCLSQLLYYVPCSMGLQTSQTSKFRLRATKSGPNSYLTFMIQTTSEEAGLIFYPLVMDYCACQSTRSVVVRQPSIPYSFNTLPIELNLEILPLDQKCNDYLRGCFQYKCRTSVPEIVADRLSLTTAVIDPHRQHVRRDDY